MLTKLLPADFSRTKPRNPSLSRARFKPDYRLINQLDGSENPRGLSFVLPGKRTEFKPSQIRNRNVFVFNVQTTDEQAVQAGVIQIEDELAIRATDEKEFAPELIDELKLILEKTFLKGSVNNRVVNSSDVRIVGHNCSVETSQDIEIDNCLRGWVNLSKTVRTKDSSDIIISSSDDVKAINSSCSRIAGSSLAELVESLFGEIDQSPGGKIINSPLSKMRRSPNGQIKNTFRQVMEDSPGRIIEGEFTDPVNLRLGKALEMLLSQWWEENFSPNQDGKPRPAMGEQSLLFLRIIGMFFDPDREKGQN